MAGKAINQYNTFSGSASDVNVLVQETSQTDPNTYEHKKAKLDTIIATLKNIANGLAGLDGNGLIPESLLPAKYDDVVEGYYYNGVFYTTSAHITAMPATTGRIYIDLGGTGNLYRYTGSAYVQITDNDLRDDVEEDVAEIEADLANTNNRVTSNSQRIANIEDKSEPFTIEYPSSDYGKGTVPASIEKSGMSVKVKGKTRAWNQLVENGDFSSTSGWYSRSSNVSLSANNNTATLTANVSFTATFSQFGFQRDIEGTVGHKYFFSVDVKTSVSGSYKVDLYSSSESDVFRVLSANIWTTHCGVIDAISTTDGKIYYYNAETLNIPQGATMQFRKIIVRDLTLIFGAGNEPSTVADALAQLPALGQYNAYNADSLVDTVVSGVKSVGVNIWDEEWDHIAWDASGSYYQAPGYIGSKNKIRVQPNTAYYFHFPASIISIIVWDANGNAVINGGIAHVYTMPSTAYEMVFFLANYSTDYNHDIQICLNSYPQKTVYHPYSSDSITFSEPVTLRSAGSVEDELIPESGKVKHPVKEIDLTDVVFTYNSSIQRFYCALYDGKSVSSPVYSNPNAVCSAYVNINNANKVYSELANMQFVFADRSFNSTPFFIFRDDSHNGSSLDSSGHAPWLSGHKLAYELATPATDTISPSPTALAVEPYGEVSLIQDQDIELDGGFSMRYIPDSPYVKKADIVDNLNSSDVSKPLSANMGKVIGATLNQHDSRIKNLEQKAGDYSIVQYRGTNAVPTGKAKYGLVKSIDGKTRAWNQMIPELRASNFSGSFIYASYLSNDSNMNLVATASSGINITLNNIDIYANHTYLLKLMAKADNNNTPLAVYSDASSTGVLVTFQNADTWYDFNVLFTPNANKSSITLVNGQTPCVLTVNDWELFDLTLIFGAGNEPSTVADALAQLPALGQYNAYDAGSLVDTVVSGVKSVGVNIWDEEWEVGGLDVYSGANNPSNENIRSANYIPLVVGESYYVIIPANVTMNAILFYGEAKDYLGIDAAQGMTASGTLTIPPSARFMRFQMNTAYGTTYNHDIQICLNSLPDAIKTTYHPYKTDTLPLSTPVTLRSAGSVAEVLTLETGKKTRPIGSVDLGTLDYTILSAGYNHYFISTTTLDINPLTMNALASGYVIASSSSYGDMPDRSIRIEANKYITIRNEAYDASIPADIASFKASLSGVMMNYELATPLSDEQVCDPIPYNFLEVQGGGTIETIQTQSPVIDNCLDVGYLAI